MSTKQMAYDNPAYQARYGNGMGEVGGGATTQYGKFVAFTAMLAFSAQMTVTTAGTATTHSIAVSKISGTATTALGTQTIGTAVAGTTFNLLLTNVAGGVSLAQGDVLIAITGADAAGKAALAYEVGLLPQANITA